MSISFYFGCDCSIDDETGKGEIGNPTSYIGNQTLKCDVCGLEEKFPDSIYEITIKTFKDKNGEIDLEIIDSKFKNKQEAIDECELDLRDYAQLQKEGIFNLAILAYEDAGYDDVDYTYNVIKITEVKG